jgi:heat shock protein HslJ
MRRLPLALSLALSACGLPRTGPGLGGAVEGVWWVLESYTGRGRVETGKSCRVWLTFANEGFGSKDCNNRFSGAAPVSGAQIAFRIDVSTKVEASEFDTVYRSNLLGARTFTAGEEQLVLFDGADYQLAVFRASLTDPSAP